MDYQRRCTIIAVCRDDECLRVSQNAAGAWLWWHSCYHLEMLIVVDTNIFVGACLGMEASSTVIRNCILGLHIPLMGNALFSEHLDVLARNAPFSKSKLGVNERNELLDIYLASCRWTPIYFGWRPNLADEADNRLIELAVAGNASHIVSRNLRDLRRAELHFPSIHAVTPEHFLKETTP